MFKIYNTLTKKREIFFFKKIIKIYVCGITVYDHCHIGHIRIFLFFDTLIRYFNYLNLGVVYVRNITDIDDKIINRALKLKQSIQFITEKYTKDIQKINKRFNFIEPSFEPKATNFIDKMILLINKLIDNKYAYISKYNDICFCIKNFRFYGKLSKSKKNNINNIKTNSDFVLWKHVDYSEKNKWISKWGFGRPGWHTECSAMVIYYSKNLIDIHGGGRDLIFPHHENEISQFDSLFKNGIVKIWIHIGSLKIFNKKMSKTKKNYILAKDLLNKFNEEVIRFFFLMTHYKSSIFFSFENLRKIKNIFEKFVKLIHLLKFDNYEPAENFKLKFFSALNNDFNTPKAISVLFDLLKIINKEQDLFSKKSQNLIFTLKYLGNILGIFKNIFFKKKSVLIEKLIESRNFARIKKNWKLSDNIRNKLEKMNIKVEDGKSYSNYFELL